MRHVRSYLLGQGLNPHPLHWKVKSYPQDHQGSPELQLFLLAVLPQINYTSSLSLGFLNCCHKNSAGDGIQNTVLEHHSHSALLSREQLG